MKTIKILFFLLFLLYSFPLWSQTDIIPTSKGAVTVTPVLHSSMVLEWNGKTILVDPYGGAEKYAAYPEPDLVLISDIHGDHLNKETLNGLQLSNAVLVAPKAVQEQLADMNFKEKITLANGEEALLWDTIPIQAIPMYNLPEDKDSRHPKGRGNGYLIDVGTTRFYLAGDTEDIPEMRLLTDVDVAFVPMNLPYTMPVAQAADGVAAFKPAVVYPYHYRGANNNFSDLEKFKALVNAKSPGTEVRIRDWYPAAKAK